MFFASRFLSGNELNSSSGVFFVVSKHFSIRFFKLSSNKFEEEIEDFFLPFIFSCEGTFKIFLMYLVVFVNSFLVGILPVSINHIGQYGQFDLAKYPPKMN